MKQLRIGFLSTANIARKNWKAIRDSGNCVVSAVASRDEKKSREFVQQCQKDSAFDIVPDALGSYEALVTAPNVDAVYMPLPTALRREWGVRAAKNGKHILCEKPCTKNVAELEEVFSVCRNHGVQFLDGVMFMHNPRLLKIRAVLDDGQSLGRLQRMSSGFSFYAGDGFFESNIRVDGALEPAGCLGDLGWYPIRFFLWALNWQLPRMVSARILAQTASGVPTEFSAELLFDGGISGEFYSSFLTAGQQWVAAGGRKGWLRMVDFVLPRSGYEPAFELNGSEVSAGDGDTMAQETRMWRNFANQILSGKLNEEWPMWATKTQKVMDACLEAGRTGKTVETTVP